MTYIKPSVYRAEYIVNGHLEHGGVSYDTCAYVVINLREEVRQTPQGNFLIYKFQN